MTPSERTSKIAGLLIFSLGTVGLFGTAPVFAQTGTNLAEFAAPASNSGNGRGLAFDGLDLYYTLNSGTDIIQVTTGGAFVTTITPTCPASVPLKFGRVLGALAFDATGPTPTLWAATYDLFPTAIVQVDIVTGTILQSIDMLPTNALDLFPGFIDGLAFDPGDTSLFYSSDLGFEVFNISAMGGPGCTAFTAVQNPARGYVLAEGDMGGHAFDGINLYVSQPADFSAPANANLPPQILQTPDNAPTINLNFQTLGMGGGSFDGEDLAFDNVTFAPTCAVWANQAAAFNNNIAAFEVPCPNPNQPPVAVCMDVITPTDPGVCTASVSVDGGSFDPDGDPFSLSQSPPSPYLVGNTTVTLTVTDIPFGASDSCTATVTVQDQTSPGIGAVSATPGILWPPNHKMVPVTVNVSASDLCSGTPTCQIISVSSNEPVDGQGDGHTDPDWNITGNLTVDLRAERSGQGDGREYTVTVQCSDGSGNTSTGNTTVFAPHDQS